MMNTSAEVSEKKQELADGIVSYLIHSKLLGISHHNLPADLKVETILGPMLFCHIEYIALNTGNGENPITVNELSSSLRLPTAHHLFGSWYGSHNNLSREQGIRHTLLPTVTIENLEYTARGISGRLGSESGESQWEPHLWGDCETQLKWVQSFSDSSQPIVQTIKMKSTYVKCMWDVTALYRANHSDTRTQSSSAEERTSTV